MTFGSFNRHAKITDGVLDAWKRCWTRCRSRALSARVGLSRTGHRRVAARTLARRGLPVDRIDFLPFVPLDDAIAAYRDIDVALDTFPYNGG